MTEILINANDRRIQYTASAAQTVFPYDFPIYANTEITVLRLRAGVLSTLILTTDFTVSGVGAEAGGNIVLEPPGATAGDILTIYGTTPYERTTDYGTGGDFKATTVNKDFDRLAMMAQQLDVRVGRSLSLNIADSSTPLQFSIQTTVERQSGILSFDATGTKVETVRTLADFDGDVSQTATNAANAAASEAAAATSESNAATSETNAAASEDAAALSATSAATSASNAATSATNASNSATAAATSATNSGNSATSAATSATTATTQATNASNSATSAATSATNSANSASAAATSESNAATSEANAAASAAASAASAAALKGTSTTSLAVSVAQKIFTTQTGKQFNVGQFMLVVSDAAPATDWMFGQISAYSGTSLTLEVSVVGGSGTHTDWSLYIAGARGATGLTGIAGSVPVAAAGGTADAITADFTPDLTLADKTICVVIAGSANATTTPTFAPDGLTARTIVKDGGKALVAGDIRAAGHALLLEYNLANTRWELLNPSVATKAEVLNTARTINGTSFDGSTNITVTSAAGTLTGTTLNATVVSSSLTSVGTIATGVWNGTKVGEAYGGTNQTTYTQGDLLYASAANTLSKLAKGTALQVLRMNAGATIPEWAALAGIATIARQTFTASGTYTPNAKMLYCLVEGCGGGAGGGGSTGNANTPAGGGGGGGGGFVLLTAAQIGASQTVTIGAAGAAGSSAGGNGGAGGTTSLGALFSVAGGAAGPGSTASGATTTLGGAGGGFSTADVGYSGDAGGIGLNAAANVAFSGFGGSSMYGAGGNGRTIIAGSGTGNAGIAKGSGGGGALGNGNAGGAGIIGYMTILEFCSP